MSAGVANSPVFWIALITALAALYALPTVIGLIRHVENLALVVILNLFPVGWPAALVIACMMPPKNDMQPLPARCPVPGKGRPEPEPATGQRWWCWRCPRAGGYSPVPARSYPALCAISVACESPQAGASISAWGLSTAR
jgi:hypothetical protein